MTQPAQTDASAIPDGLLPAQQTACSGNTALDFTGKEADGAELKEPRNSLDQNAEHGAEYLLKLVASLEACNMALLSKLNQAGRELAALRQPPAHTLPGTEPTANPEQSYGWERKLTRAQWRPT